MLKSVSVASLLPNLDGQKMMCEVQAEGQAFCNFSEGLLLAFAAFGVSLQLSLKLWHLCAGPLNFAPTYQHIPGQKLSW